MKLLGGKFSKRKIKGEKNLTFCRIIWCNIVSVVLFFSSQYVTAVIMIPV